MDMQSVLAEEEATLLEANLRRECQMVLEKRSILRVLAQHRRQLRDRERFSHDADEISLAAWRSRYAPREVVTVPTRVTKSRIWTWVDGPKFDGDLDIIIPGYHPDVAVKVYLSEKPWVNRNMLIRPYIRQFLH